uniref:Putative secreted peptide n=1 Tax=Anopheles braziliensis TaxID=58242 RepID=A0A2M3ZPA2_9DIPT
MQPFLRFLLLRYTVLCGLVYFACVSDGSQASRLIQEWWVSRVTQRIFVRMQVCFPSICTEMCEPGNKTYCFAFPSLKSRRHTEIL